MFRSSLASLLFLLTLPGAAGGQQYAPSPPQVIWTALDSLGGWVKPIGARAGETCRLQVSTGRVLQPHPNHPNADTGTFRVTILRQVTPRVPVEIVVEWAITDQEHGTFADREVTFTVPGVLGEELWLELGTINGAKFWDDPKFWCQVFEEDFDPPYYVVAGPPYDWDSASIVRDHFQTTGNLEAAAEWPGVHAAIALPGMNEFLPLDAPPPPPPTAPDELTWPPGSAACADPAAEPVCWPGVELIQDDPAAPDSDWLAVPPAGGDDKLRIGFPTPGEPLVFSQTVRLLVRPAAGAPRIRVQLFDGLTFRANLAVNLPVTEEEVLTLTFNPGWLLDPTGAGVQLLLTVTQGDVEVGAAEWILVP